MSNVEIGHAKPANWWRIAFYIAAVSAVAAACLPSFPPLPQQLSDKALHFGAFVVLTTLAILAYPKARSGVILVSLSSLGLGIELLQSISWINRSSEGLDLIADVVAIGLTLLFFRVGRSLTGKFRRAQAD